MDEIFKLSPSKIIGKEGEASIPEELLNKGSLSEEIYIHFSNFQGGKR